MRALRKTIATILVLFSAFFLIPIPALAAPIINIGPASFNTTVGSFFDVSVEITSVSDLFAFQFDIGFDPGIVSAKGVTEGSFLASGGSTSFFPGSIDNTAGTISFTNNSLVGFVSGVSGSGTLALLSFDALAPGISPIGLSNVLLLDSFLGEIPATAQDGAVTVAGITVPEPATLFLMGIGMAVYGIVRKKGGQVI